MIYKHYIYCINWVYCEDNKVCTQYTIFSYYPISCVLKKKKKKIKALEELNLNNLTIEKLFD